MIRLHIKDFKLGSLFGIYNITVFQLEIHSTLHKCFTICLENFLFCKQMLTPPTSQDRAVPVLFGFIEYERLYLNS